MTQNDTLDTRGGGNTRKPPRARAWTLTINNYEENIFDTLKQLIIDKCQNYIFGKEVGEKGTPHIQGYVSFKNARTFASMKKLFPKAHIEKAKGNLKQNYIYCSKEKNFITNIDLRTKKEIRNSNILESEYKNVEWKQWQKKVIEEINGPINSRQINWIWDKNGNIGKSYLVKYLALTTNVIIANGKKNDVFNQINVKLEKDEDINLILLDIPRDSINYFNYGGIEAIKNGCLYSGKYEGGVCLFKIPHVFIFANSAPKLENMSEDRWNVREVDTSLHFVSASPPIGAGAGGA